MRKQIRAFCENGGPVYGECGGFMYLCESISDLEDNTFPMVGLYPFQTRMQARLSSLGYRRPLVRRDCLLGPEGSVLHGHEFHYSTLGDDHPEIEAMYSLEDGRPEGFIRHNTLAGYVHLHWGRTPEAAARFVQACRHHR